ncbi:DUF2586 family protein [Leptospira santarosai]|uniref:PF10758 domain protein n=1 Tax=Leptospira santarosai str. MOR084 TaxID=1049984 RepID=A0A0E2BCY7_9LEPT|nr:DUF2586 family protein [Leptospira santarosai]EKO32780.1 hypothetical protein LEP1GSC179_3000 [Leptospira santarosai str. MOR084]
MATGDVSTYHQDGGINFNDVTPDRVGSKVGNAETGDANRIYVINNAPQARDVFGRGELVQSLEQFFEEFDESKGQKPVPVLCVRPLNDVAGTVATPVKVGNGDAALPTVAGTPTGSRVVVLKITKDGASGVAEYRKSVDGGENFSSPLITPASGSPISLDVGVIATFVNASTPANTFKVGDKFTFTISGPSASTASRLTAIETLKREYRSYWIHVLGPATRAFAMSCNAILEEMETEHHLPSFIILEARGKNDSETVPQYFQYIQDEFDPFASPNGRVLIAVGEARYIPGGVNAAGGFSAVKAAETPMGEWRNFATMATAKISAAPVNVSIGYVKDMRSLTFSEIRYWNEGYRDYMDLLHDMGLMVLKNYDDYDGIFVARDKIKAASASDFKELPERRRADKMHRILYRESLQFLNMDTEVDSGSGGLDYIKTYIDSKISAEMEAPGRQEISGHEIVLDPNRTFNTDRILRAKCRMFVSNRTHAIEWETSFATQQ